MSDNQILDRRDPRQYPCADHERRLSLAEQSVDRVERTMDAVSTKLDLILAQITKVAILEEKHQNQGIDISRAHDKIGKLEEKHDALAVEIREFMNQMKGQSKILWAIGSVVFMLVVKVLFFAANNGMTP